MSRLFAKALKIFLLLVLAGAAVAGAVLLARREGWPVWTAGAMTAGLLALVFLALFARRLFYRRREAAFVRRVVEQDQKSIEAAPQRERRSLAELQERWARAVELLRGSRLRDRGDPLYTLPWFMIFGETGSGKSTAVANARLTTILSDAGPAKGIAGTRNCDWWFFEEAVVLDTTGRYAIPLDREADREEWECFLGLLARYRRREPLSGLIVTLPADRLLADDADSLAEYGRSIRLRVDQLMRGLGARFPVYVLVTKLDLVLGMTALCDLLPEKERGQAMGVLDEEEARPPEEFAAAALDDVARRLKSLRLLVAERAGRGDGKAALFPDEFERLIPSILAFVRGAFCENPYQETPLLRGIFISSGRQSGLTRSGVLGGLPTLRDAAWRLPDTGRGLFLHDFFSAILPRDRGLSRRLDEYFSWRAATRSLGLLAWMLAMLTVIGFSSMAYVHVRDAMEPVRASFPQPPRLGRGLAEDFVQLGLLRSRILAMQDRLHGGFWPGMGYDQGEDALNALKRQYCAWFLRYALDPLDEAMNGRFAALGVRGRDDRLPRALEYLVWRVDVLNAKLQGGEPKPGGEPVAILALAFGRNLPEVSSYFPDMYRSYVEWEGNAELLERERDELRTWTARFVEVQGADLHWLAQWAASRPGLTPVAPGDFWPGKLNESGNDPRVSPAFTAQGREAIAQLLGGISNAVTDRQAFGVRSAAFWLWYQQRFYEEWKNFAADFDAARDEIGARENWLSVGSAMSTPDNPYFRLLARMAAEFKAVEKLGPPPDWTRIPGRFAALLDAYRSRQKTAGTADKATGKAQAEMRSIAAALEDKSPARLASMRQARDVFAEYMKNLGGLGGVAASRDAAFRFAYRHFGGPGEGVPGGLGGGGQPSPVEGAVTDVQRLRLLLGYGAAVEEPVWRIVLGPVDFLVALSTEEAACSLNELWQSQVLAEVSNVPENGRWNALFGAKGVVQAFAQGPARPFLRRNERGWYCGTWRGQTFPFTLRFLQLLNAGSARRQQIQPKYSVFIEALPTNVNEGARSEPNSVVLRLQSAPKPQQLDNYNYQQGRQFVWNPDTCGDVTLEIAFPEVTLRKTWPGAFGFRDFLRDFRTGREVLVPRDFPESRTLLEGLGVTNIQVNFAIRGARPVLSLRDFPILSLPDVVTTCGAGDPDGEGS